MTTDAVDLSVILTAHDETLVAGPTLAAADAAIACAEAAGFTVERIITLDNATPGATAWFGQARFAHWDRRVMTEGDVGRVRNAMLHQTRGRYLAFLDADDLYSENWLREGVRALDAAAARGQKAIAHPELNWLFDGAHSVFCKPDLDDPLYSPWHFYFMNYYDSLCMAPRAAHLEHPYVHRDIPAGLSFQDWQFSIETIAAGWHHLAAKDTIIFKRRRDTSLVTESRARRALVRAQAALRLDQVDALGRAVPDRPVSDPASDPVSAQADLPALPNLPATEPHFGQAFADRIARAKARRGHVKPADQEAYDTIAPHFDHLHYLSAYRDIAALEEVDPVAHYIRAGIRERRNPTPWFSTADYLARYPDVAERGINPFFHWLSEGRAAGYRAYPVQHFEEVAATIGVAPDTAKALWQSRFEDLRARLMGGELGAQAQKAARHEPLVEQGWPDALTPKIPPFHADHITARTAGIWTLAQAAGQRRARYVICLNRARFGAAPRIEGQIARSLAARVDPSEIVVITTDAPGPMPEGKFPEGVRVVDFAGLVPDLKGDPRQRLLAEFLRALAPEAVFNVNARLMWDMMSSYGRALSASIRLYACLLCNERTPSGFATGYPLRRVYRHFEDLSGLFTDSRFLADEICARHMLDADQATRVQVLPNPVDPGLPVITPAAKAGPPQIFWAGRLDTQKRVDLVHAIARALPDLQFRLWGEPVMGSAPVPTPPENVTHEGAYARFTDLPLQEADMWLYTSAWDGVPTMLLEVAMTGIPLVGGLVGGTGEVLRPGLATALEGDAPPEVWAGAIRAQLAAPEAARKAALTLRETLIAERTPEAHQAALFAGLDRRTT